MPVRIVHLTSSTFFGGPERQMLGLASALAGSARTLFLSFREGGHCASFLSEAEDRGFDARALEHDSPRFAKAVREVVRSLRAARADVLLCHGYKADLLGLAAARIAGVPVAAVSRGWTGEDRKVRAYEALDRLALRAMDRVVCVSEGQAGKVLRAGVAPVRVAVIRNAIRPERFADADPRGRRELLGSFAMPVRRIVCGAGRLSPEKGFHRLVAAAARIAKVNDSIGFLLFGDGPLRGALARQIEDEGLAGRFLLAGFRDDLDRLLPTVDLMVLPSDTEGLPNVALETAAAGVPVVATAVGGTPEAVEHGTTGLLIPPEDVDTLTQGILGLLDDEPRRRAMGERGRRMVRERFSFEEQARLYLRLFEELAGSRIEGRVKRCVAPSASAS
jgi:glycosyltransferase involved in cell wall biosynthesis